jgi:hypothetical protein
MNKKSFTLPKNLFHVETINKTLYVEASNANDAKTMVEANGYKVILVSNDLDIYEPVKEEPLYSS